MMVVVIVNSKQVELFRKFKFLACKMFGCCCIATPDQITRF